MKKFGFLLIFLLTISANVFAQDFSSRIIGGEEAEDGEYPWAVALVSSGSSNAFNGQFCGGALIGNQWVLTAAHCLAPFSTSQVNLVIGRHDLRTDTGIRVASQQFIIHPDYNDETSDNDIGLIKLASPVTQTTIGLPTPSVISTITTGSPVTAIGWGTTMHANDVSSAPSPVLLEVILPIVSQSVCALANNITENMICAGLPEGGKDTCQGDSGGPLVSKQGGEFFLIGATSFGNGCALPNSPGVYTKVSKFLEFIKGNTGIEPGQGGGSGGGDDDTDDGESENNPPVPPPSCFPTDGTFPVLNSSEDTDGDGSSDLSETTNGTNQNDPGSLAQKLTSPTYALWTGFLNITPIAELINRGTETGAVAISFFNQDGSLASVTRRAVPAGGQVDVIISDVEGFTTDSHGLLKIDFCNMKLDGRMAYYRPTGNGDFDFAYSIPFNGPMYGNSFVSFNTFQPSINPEESKNLVANWLTLVNLSSSARAFTVNKYDAAGNLLETRALALAGGERRDIEAGHINPGPSNLGLIKILPSNPSSAYRAVLMRYGSNDSSGAGTDGYSFAFPLLAQSGNGENAYAPLTTTVNSKNWLEVVNTLDEVATATINFYLSNRTNAELIDTQSIALAPRSQIHFDVNAKLGNAKLGYVEILPGTSNSLVAQSMVYTFDEGTGSIANMYGSQAREALGNELFGSFNLYLGMFNYLKLINVSSTDQIFSVLVNNGSSARTVNVYLPTKGSLDLPIHNGISFGTSPNTLGTIKIQPLSIGGVDVTDITGAIVSELLRIRLKSNNDGQIDYIFPTSVRFTDDTSS